MTVTRRRKAHLEVVGDTLAVVPDSATEEVIDGELVEELTGDEAEEITTRIQSCIKNWHMFEAQTTELALKAYYGQAFKALGFESWSAYTSAKFGDLELPRSTQAAINSALINQGGISSRSAAAISGTDHKTASADARNAQEAAGESSPPGDREESARAQTGKVTGSDGKLYPVTKPQPVPEPVKPPKPAATTRRKKLSPEEKQELHDFCAGLVDVRARILAEEKRLASQPSQEADPLIRAIAALRFAVGEIVQHPAPGHSDEFAEQVEAAFRPLLHWAQGPIQGKSKAAQQERDLRADYVTRWQELGRELDLATLIKLWREGWV